PRSTRFPYTTLFRSTTSRKRTSVTRAYAAGASQAGKSGDVAPAVFRPVTGDLRFVFELMRSPRHRSDQRALPARPAGSRRARGGDRKSTRLNSSHVK